MKTTFNELIKRGSYSIDTRNKQMTADTFLNAIIDVHEISKMHHEYANHGFYRIGQLLVKARSEFKGEWGKLKKQIVQKGLSEKQQERYMAVASDPMIQKHYAKLPHHFTFWLKIVQLRNKDKKEGTNNFKKIEHMISPEAIWQDVEQKLGKHQQLAGGNRSRINERDNRQEIFGLEYDYKVATKKHKYEFNQFEKEVTKLVSKYKFIKLNKKNYLNDAKDILNKDPSKTKDDTSKATKRKFKMPHNPRKTIDI